MGKTRFTSSTRAAAAAAAAAVPAFQSLQPFHLDRDSMLSADKPEEAVKAVKADGADVLITDTMKLAIPPAMAVSLPSIQIESVYVWGTLRL